MSLPPDQRQICFRVPVEKAERIKAAAMKEGIREMGPFCRELIEWAFEHYEDATSLYLLKRARVDVPRLDAEWLERKKALTRIKK
jgi:predicted DNA-binding protein